MQKFKELLKVVIFGAKIQSYIYCLITFGAKIQTFFCINLGAKIQILKRVP